MRLGGVDPSILRELSGVYKPFVKAVKELVSNAYDADADSVSLSFSDDFSSLTVTDDGHGMTPFEFRSDFTRIGGGSRRWSGDKTRKGRLRIGSKGIGFLALARYCDRLKVRSRADRTLVVKHRISKTPASVDISGILGVPVDLELLGTRIRAAVRRPGRGGAAVKQSAYQWDRKGGRLKFLRDCGAVILELHVKCSDLLFDAVLDFERLLQLADNADLEKLDDFASIEIRVEPTGDKAQRGTTVTAEGLKPFVRRELKVDRRKGFVRNIASRGGLDQFSWHLSRCTPLPYADCTDADRAALLTPWATSKQSLLNDLRIVHGGTPLVIKRPVYPLEAESPPVPSDMRIAVEINEAGLRARGIIAAYESVIFPAEYRGIAVRVRGVQIGDAHFLGAEHLLTGANKAALSQISGEINVRAGLDAADTLNPGRESFYEESEHYKVLRRHLVGEGEHVGGHLWRAITAVLRRSQVNSALADVMGRAGIRRRALDDVAAAIAQLVARRDPLSDAVRAMLKSRSSDVNGLGEAPDHHLEPPDRVGGLPVKLTESLAEAFEVDYAAQQVRLDKTRPAWNWNVRLFDRPFQVIHKWGKPDQSLAETDLKEGEIYVNWGHPLKQQMDERGFLRFALTWALAKHTPAIDSRSMMDLALQLLSYTTSGNG